MTSPDAPLLEVVRRWVARAEQDLIVAEHTLTLPSDKCAYEVVAFHAQQCAEKYLKAVLLARGADVPKTHDLGVILDRLAGTSGGAPAVAETILDQLNPFAVRVRYPDDMSDLQREDAERAVDSARAVRDAVRATLIDAGVLSRTDADDPSRRT